MTHPTHPLLQTPIAIVGMACCLPGARNLAEFWELLRSGRDAITELPPDRLDRDLYYHPVKGKRGKTYSSLGGVIPDRPLENFASLMTDSNGGDGDPCHRILCDVAIEACVEGGFDVRDFPYPNTGVYIGHSGGSTLGGDLAFAVLAEEALDYLHDIEEFAALDPDLAQTILRETGLRLRKGRPRRNSAGGPDVEANCAAALVAKALRLNGPHYSIDAACSSSLVALVAAGLALNQGYIDAAIVAGASFNKSDSLILFSQAQSCSASGTRPFDDRADGLISSEGYVALVVKLLPKAIADGDAIHAVVRGLGVSSDGRGRSLWAPRKEGQLEAVRRAYGPGVDPRNVQFIEAHATSTQVGDATELEALATFFTPLIGDRKIPLGSVKSNIGHTLETAGLAGLTKAVLALRHGEIPPTINLEQLNASVPWERLPFTVPTEVQPWPRVGEDQPRCAAVNAFGIGGLNVHVVVEEYLQKCLESDWKPLPRGVTRSGVSALGTSSPGIAIIGRGVILPGAASVAEFRALLHSDRSAISDAPDGRWRKQIGVRAGAVEPGAAPLARGGYIQDYAYDWKTYKVPPKQVAQANPLQFMLLDAARAALAEAGYDRREFDRSGTAVVIGSIFGGEFGNQLQIGLRLPEIRRELSAELRRHGFSENRAEPLIDAFERRILQAKPALLDETGSFTSSTLASRLSKTLNLMGGALALDAGDCSSFAALSLASDLLRSGAVSHVLCGAAQRSMDLPAFESLALHGRLARIGSADDGYLPGEGVVVVLLKRLDDAVRDGDQVCAVIEGIGAGMGVADLAQAIDLSARRAMAAGRDLTPATRHLEFGCGAEACDAAERSGLTAAYGNRFPQSPNRLVRRIGHTQAVHGLATLVAATAETPMRSTGISVHTSSGLAYHLLLAPHAHTPARLEPPSIAAEQPEPAVPHVWRGSAASREQVLRQFKPTTLDDAKSLRGKAGSFSVDHAVRMAIVSTSPADLAAKCALAKQADEQLASRDLLWEQGIYIHTRRAGGPRIAWAFPGQGSQYPGMLRELVQYSPAAAKALNEVDAVLAKLGLARFADLVWKDPDRLGTDLRVTQIAMLLSDYLALAAVRECGLRPDCVFGHSFGEFAALIAADALTLRQAVELTLARTQAMARALSQPSGMLSIHAAPSAVQAVLQPFHERVFVSHHNAPEQMVVGGTADAIAELESHLVTLGIRTRRLDVPAAFHTQLMQPMLADWSVALRHARIDPPRVPLLSSVTNKFVADPEDIRHNLAIQMVTPVRYVELIERLSQAGFDAIVEVGPQQILTRLHRRILANSAVACVALDHPRRPVREQMTRMLVELECLGWAPQRHSESDEEPLPPLARRAIEHFDATGARKLRRRTESRDGQERSPTTEPIARFDATQARRDRQRSELRSDMAGEKTEGRGNVRGGEIVRAASHVTTERDGHGGSNVTTERDGHGKCDVTAERGGHGKCDVTAERDGYGGERDGFERVLLEFVVEQTGYPADLIDLDWDLEADLGIDSIKRAQLFGELRELFQLEATDGGVSLNDYRTLRQIADLLRARNSTSANLRDTVAVGLASRRAAEPPVQPNSAVPTRSPAVVSSSRSTLETFLIDFVVEQTGYPREVVDLDADFEADLGIDSIKKSQLFGELREQFRLNVDDSNRFSLADFQTLRQVLALLDDANTREAESATRVVELAPPPHQPALNGYRHHTHSDTDDDRYRVGLERGRKNTAAIRALLRRSADRHGPRDLLESTVGEEMPAYCAGDWSELRGLADGAGVHVDCILAFQRSGASDDPVGIVRVGGTPSPNGARKDHAEPTAPRVASRYVLRMAPRARQPGTGNIPRWHGPAVILGDNSLAHAIVERCLAEGRKAFIVTPGDDPMAAVRELDRIWREQPAPHLFIVTPRDEEARTTWDADAFDRRRRRGVSTPFWFCQRWMKAVVDSGLMDAASIVGVTALGGDFGFAGSVDSVESGAITGLLKSIIIESWVSGYRTIPIKLVDAPPDAAPRELVDSIWTELASPSYDVEIAVRRGERWVVRAHRQETSDLPKSAVPVGGNWVCTGGARGITAIVARELGLRFGLRLHLLGLSPMPQLPEGAQERAASDLKRWKLEFMQSARASGRNAIQEWERVEKALEIDRTLRMLRELGITAHYHPCDVSDRDSLRKVLAEIRRSDGPIDGVLHGAGVGKDARFDRKEPGRVEECIRAKVDGARALMELTRQDPLRFFIAFGSISGRFGANGHTDYSLANDMLCKQVDWYRRQRPEVKAVAFHWHAWGDVGMATKAETRLALELVGMQFMPAAEGVAHLIGELESQGADTEVLITDDRYYRLFYPAETLDEAQETAVNADSTPPALLRDAAIHSGTDSWTAAVTLDPRREPFLVEHRLDDRPVLPIVVGLELLVEAAIQSGKQSWGGLLSDVEALRSLRFHTDRPLEVRVHTKPVHANPHDSQAMQCELRADFSSRDGRLIEASRCYLRAVVHLCGRRQPELGNCPTVPQDGWEPVVYGGRGSKMYLGSPLQCLRGIRLDPGVAWGRIVAPALVELAGPHRAVEGWSVPSAVVDACLYATGLLCWSQVAPGATLPVRFGHMEFGRMPHPGEACLVETRLVRREGSTAVFQFALFGNDGSPLIRVTDYHVAWITS